MNSALWYFGRGTGTTALVLFSLVVVLGIVTRSGSRLPGLPRFVMSAVHRTTSLTALVFLALHVGSLFFDPYAQLRLVNTVVPFLASYKPIWQGLGTVAADLVLVLIGSSLLRHRLGLQTWRALHWGAYLCWPLAVLHAVGNGTDGTSSWMLLVVAGCGSAVGLAAAWRITGRRFGPDAPPVAVLPPADLAGLR